MNQNVDIPEEEIAMMGHDEEALTLIVLENKIQTGLRDEISRLDKALENQRETSGKIESVLHYVI